MVIGNDNAPERNIPEAAPRTTVTLVRDSVTGRTYLQGTETSSRERANVFGAWRDEEPDLDEDFDYEGRYFPARTGDEVHIEVEVTFSFYAQEEIEDHAEVYWWQTYHWKIDGETVTCTKDPILAGDYLVEAGGLDGPLAIYSPLISAGVYRIRQERWNKVVTPPRLVGAP